MIITIKGADFSSANIGTLSTYIISKSIGRGASYDIPSFVEKNSSVNWVITLGEDYTFGTYSVTMGGEVVTPSVNGNEMTIAIANVTGNIRITVATVYNGVEELPEPDEPTIPDDPVVPPVEPDNTNLALKATIKEGQKLINSNTLTFNEDVNYNVYHLIPVDENNTYRTNGGVRSLWLDENQNGLQTFMCSETSNILNPPSGAKYVSITVSAATNLEMTCIYYPEMDLTSKTNIITSGEIKYGKTLSSSSYTTSANEDFDTYDLINVEPGKTYKISDESFRMWWVKSDNSGINTLNLSSVKNRIITAPSNAEFLSISFRNTNIPISDAYVVEL